MSHCKSDWQNEANTGGKGWMGYPIPNQMDLHRTFGFYSDKAHPQRLEQ